MNNDHTLVFDVGKTNVKLILLNQVGHQLSTINKSNTIINEPPYPHYDIEGIWKWFLSETKKVANKYRISTIAISTHGAAAALVDIENSTLLLPVMDYEFEDYPVAIGDYDDKRPDFNCSFSPKLSAGLNLGRQLFYQLSLLSDDEREKATLLFYPAYWAWRLSTIATTEITSVGCHTDLWNFKTNRFSDLVTELGLKDKIPAMIKAWQPVGIIKKELVQQTGIDENCVIFPGLHDSNAGLIQYLSPNSLPPTVISTGTWVVAMDPKTPLDTLVEEKDMLANINIMGEPIATARYMGGREFEKICALTGADVCDKMSTHDIHSILEQEIFAFPSFISGSGPYPEKKGNISGSPKNGKVLATIYSALMINELLNNLQSSGNIVIEGRFAGNRTLCSLLAALRPNQNIFIQNETTGIAEGCAKLVHWHDKQIVRLGEKVVPFQSCRLDKYASKWRRKLSQNKQVLDDK
jgi:sugar (pentulose or hexulose) kinase